MPLKLIPRVVSSQLLYVLSRMGHGDTLVFGDANFPSVSNSKFGPELVDATGLDIPTLLEATLQLVPLDTFVPKPVGLMQVVPGGDVQKPPIWDKYQQIVNDAEGREIKFELIERSQFYDRAKKAFAIVATGEQALYGNVLITKGTIPPDSK